jgi:TRAF3-interacting protein 1
LFEGDFLDARAISGKANKIEYLDKIVLCVGIALGAPCEVRTNKVVAGLEPERTNLFLQQLGQAATRKDLDFADIVQRTLNGEEPGRGEEGRAGEGGRAEESKSGRGEESKISGNDASSKMQDDEAVDRRREEEEARERRDQEERAERRRRKEEAAANEAATAAATTDRGGGGSGPTLSADDINGDWQRTAELVGSIISKPSMKQKLLSRPPFRFLADTIINIQKATGFLSGLFEGSEMNPKEIKDKQAKVEWLNKLLNAVGLFWNTTMNAKSSKIIAGLEADFTNELMQAVALGAKSGENSNDAVRKTLSGEKASSGRSGDDGGGGSSKSDEGDGASSKIASPPRSSQPVRSTAKVEKKKVVPEEETKESRSSRSSRPSTARRRPPKLKENVQEGKSGGTAQPVRGIMTEGADEDEDEDEEETNALDDDRGGLSSLSGMPSLGGQQVDKETAGKLVRDIMDDEEQRDKQREGKTASLDDLSSNKSSIRMGKIGRKKKKRDKDRTSRHHSSSSSSAGGKSSTGELSNDELEELRRAIQSISQSTHPLSKCMDFVHDDVALMNEEAEEWHKMYRNKIGIMEAASKDTDDALQNLVERREEIRDQIAAEKLKINSVKASIAMNDVRIAELLQMVVHTSR